MVHGDAREDDVPPARSKTSPVRASPSAVPIPRVMFSTPEATPDCCSGTDPMIAALLGGVKQPNPIPTSARRARKPSVVGRSAPRANSPMATSDIPPTVRGRAPRRSARRPGERCDHTEGQRHHHELEAGLPGTDPQPPLEVEGHEEEHAEHDQVGQQPTRDAPPKPGTSEQREIEHRVGMRDAPTCTKAIARATPTTITPRINGEVHPAVFPNETADRMATTAGKNMDSPFQSNGTRSCRWRLRGMSSRPAMTPSTPKGTLTMKIRRQPPAARSSPPTDGPRASPIAWAAPWIPIALPSDARGTAMTMMATLLACSMAAPTACRTRKRDEGTEGRSEATEC